MNAEMLLRHFDRISEAPDAIPRLRRFILDLAVRGKLVEQDPHDEPAGELLKRIQMEVQKQKATGTYTFPHNFIDIPRAKLPFKVPTHWGWARLIKLADVSYGFAFKSSRFNNERRGMPLIRIRDISSTETEAYFDGDYDDFYLVRPGDYLIGMDGNFNLRKWKGSNALLNQRITRINNWKASLLAEFLAIPLQMILDHLHGTTSQTTVKHLSAKQMNGVYLPIPPLAEQHRIVAKVDELMALCDQLEAARNEREARRDRLVAASLHRIGTTMADEAKKAARFHLDQLPRLTTRPEHIKQLRQTILNLAVRGRLVPQDPNDEPAGELIKQIQAEKVRLEKEGKIKQIGAHLTFQSNELPFLIPDSWVWARTEILCEVIIDCPHSTPAFANQGIICLDTNGFKAGRLVPQKIRYVSEETYRERVKRLVPKGGDIVFAREGIAGESVIIPEDMECCLGQ